MKDGSKGNFEFVKEVVWKRALRDKSAQLLVRALAETSSGAKLCLKKAEADAILDLLSEELVKNGLDSNSEPNSYGIRIESAIDWIGLHK